MAVEYYVKEQHLLLIQISAYRMARKKIETNNINI